jgi:hypothetical protein
MTGSNYLLAFQIIIILMILNICSFVNTEESPDTELLKVYTSCTLKSSIGNRWIKGSGPPLTSWIKSFVPVFNDTKLGPELKETIDKQNVHATFSMNGKVKTIRIGKNRIIWSEYGPNQYDGWLYRGSNNAGDKKSDDDDNAFTGSNITYIYNDLSTVIHGNFSNNYLMGGRSSRIIGFRCKNGIMEIKLSAKMSDDIFKHNPVSTKYLTDQPILMDPFEKRNIFINDSKVPTILLADGIHAKKSIPSRCFKINIFIARQVDK